MQGKFYVGAYWGPRKETALECARRAELFFHMLAKYDPTFAQWYRAGRSAPRELPGHPVRQEVEEWEQLFLRGMNRTDATKKVIEVLGFSEYVWNAKTRERTRIELHCGEYSPFGPGNTCLFYPPHEGPSRERILSAPVLSGVLTYLSRRQGTVPLLPAPVRIEPVGTLGWLLILSPEPMMASNPEHVAFTARIRELLDRAGLIERPEPGPVRE